MMEYISRESIGLTDFEIILCQADENKYKSALVMLLDKIEKLPAADVRKVVLCKNCKHADFRGMGNGFVWCMENERAFPETGWCCRGEEQT